MTEEDYLLRSVRQIRDGAAHQRDEDQVVPGWAMGPFYPREHLAFTEDFEIKEWSEHLVQADWRSHSEEGPEYISVMAGTLTLICGIQSPGKEAIRESKRIKIPAGHSVVLRAGLWRRFEGTPDAAGISIRKPPSI